MKKKIIFKKTGQNAVSDVIANILLLGITVSLFAGLAYVVLNLPYNPSTPNNSIVAYVDGNLIKIEHRGGEPLDLNTKINVIIGDISDQILVDDYLSVDQKEDNKWGIGEIISYNWSGGNLSNYQIEVSVIDDISNSIVMYGLVQEGESVTIPTVYTLYATNTTHDDAILWMKYNFRHYPIGELQFSYRLESETSWIMTGWETPAESFGIYSKYIDGLVADENYEFRAELRYNTSEIIYGKIKTFKAARIPYSITIVTLSHTGTSATICMEYDFGDIGSGYVRFAYKADWMDSWIYISKNPQPPNDPEQWDPESGEDNNYCITITGLSKGTTYIYKAQLKYDSTIVEGEEESFTQGIPPDVWTNPATDIGINNAILHMDYNFNEYSMGELRFVYKIIGDSYWETTGWVGASGNSDYSKTITDLLSGTDYVFKAQLKYEMGIIEGVEYSFTTEN